MRVLLLTNPDPDFGAAMLYNGLALHLGAENVFDFPIKPSYHHGHMEPGPYGPFGWLSTEMVRGVYLKGGHPVAWKDLQSLQVKQAIAEDAFDLVIAESVRPHAMANYAFLRHKYKESKAIWIIHDGEDGPQKHFMRFSSDFYLKRETEFLVEKENVDSPTQFRTENAGVVVDQSYISKDEAIILHHPFSIPDQILKDPGPWAEDRMRAEIDILFAMGNSHPTRERMYQEIKEWAASGQSKLRWEARLLGSEDPALSYPDYTDLIDNSKYAISMRGGGEDTVRFWENLGRTGLIHDWPKLGVTGWGMGVCMGGFGENYGEDDRWSVPEIEKNILEKRREMDSLCVRGHNKARLHTNSARVKAMLATIEGMRDAVTR